MADSFFELRHSISIFAGSSDEAERKSSAEEEGNQTQRKVRSGVHTAQLLFCKCVYAISNPIFLSIYCIYRHHI